MKIKTVDVNALEWFDRVNGNSYHSVRTCINYGLPDERIIYSFFRYGYGSHYEQTALEALQKEGYFKDIHHLWQIREMGVIIRKSIKSGLKREVIAWGTK